MQVTEYMIRITDFNDPRLDIFVRLPEVQLLRYREPELGLFLAESPKVIERALDAGYEAVSFLIEETALHETERELIARCPDVPVYVAPAAVLSQMRGFQMTRGMLCAMNRRALPSVEAVCEGAKRVAVLEDVVNPTNVGAIMRSAAALGMDGCAHQDAAIRFIAGRCDHTLCGGTRHECGVVHIRLQ